MKQMICALLALLLAVAPAYAPARVLAMANFDMFLAPATASPAGSNANDCLSAAAPCETLQHVVTTLRAAFDLGCKVVSVKPAPGSYAGATLAGAQVGQCNLEDFQIVGNTGNPTATVITSTVWLKSGAHAAFKGVKITTTSGAGFVADDAARIDVGYVDFGATAGPHITAGVLGRAKIVNHYTVSGGAPQHVNKSGTGQVQIMPGVIGIFTTSETARVSFSQFLFATEGGLINVSYGSTLFWNAIGFNCSPVTECAVGARIGLALFGEIYTGANGYQGWLPGNVDGAVPANTIFN